nr:nutritionally-regulated adipose and cardiac enriched protein homolog [Cavia porcellus]
MRTTARTLSPDSSPEALRGTREVGKTVQDHGSWCGLRAPGCTGKVRGLRASPCSQGTVQWGPEPRALRDLLPSQAGAAFEASQGQQEGDRKHPPSILRRSWPERRPHEAEPPRTSRHVRFREPLEVAVHYIACREPPAAVSGGPRCLVPQRCPLLLRLALCILLGVAVGLCCSRAKSVTEALEDLRAQVLVLVLRLWHMALSCWRCLLRF